MLMFFTLIPPFDNIYVDILSEMNKSVLAKGQNAFYIKGNSLAIDNMIHKSYPFYPQEWGLGVEVSIGNFFYRQFY
jgi:hypothetical protein